VPLEVRVQALCKALEEAKTEGSPDAEKGEQIVGFKPLEEYFDTRVSRMGPFYYPMESMQFREWIIERIIAAMICVIQLIAPFCILVDEWMRDTNKLKHPRQFVMGLRLSEMLCLGTDFKDKLHTMVGFVFLQLVCLIIHCYILEQRSATQKCGLMPGDSFWFFLGNFTNQVCTTMTLLASPLLFWNQDSPTDVVINSLAVLFVFGLDDFVGQASSYMGKTDQGYARSAAWQKGLLTQCPVNISDIINPNAATASQLWCIKYNARGELLVAEPQGRQRVCKRRLEWIQAKPPDEKTPLTGWTNNSNNPENQRLWYRCSVADAGFQFPGMGTSVLVTIWKVIDVFSLFMQIMLPFAWMAVNKPCL